VPIATQTFVKLILKNMQTQLTFLPVDSLANHSHLQEKEKGQMTNATCGERCFEQFKKLNPHMSSLKMSLVLRILMADWYSSRCALTWKLKGTKFSRLLLQLQPKTHRIDETDAGLLLKTPCSADAYTENLSKKEQKFGNSGTLAQEVQTGFIYQRGMLPTPTAMDSTNATATMKSSQVKEGSMHSVTLTRAMSMGILPTPNARDWKDSIGNGKDAPSIGLTRGYSLGQKLNSMLPTPDAASGKTGYMGKNRKGKQQNLETVIRNSDDSLNSQLNPRFVAEMMGFPPNWTELPFLNGETNPSKDTETQ